MASTGLGWSRALRSRLARNQLARAGTPWSHSRVFQPRRVSFLTGEPEDIDPKEGDKIYPEPEDSGHRSSTPIPLLAREQRPLGELGSVRTFGDKEEREILMRIAMRTLREGNLPERRIILRDLDWLEDPDSLARHTGRLLENGKVERAVEMVREAQTRHMRCVVSWNRIIDFCTKHGHMKPALRFFNDMKKRGGKPNAHTITILLAGMRQSPTVQGINMLQVAENLVKSMSSPNSVVEPHIYHMNALLSICETHGTADDLWRIAGELPEEGPLSPDMSTYSTIFGALRKFAKRDVEDMMNVDLITDRKHQLIKEGKRIWADVLHRWENDNFELDNQLVQAFASLLLEGASDHDYYDALALYNQTMGIPIKASEPTNRTRASSWVRRELKRSIEARKAAAAEEDVPFVDEQDQDLKLGEETRPQKKPRAGAQKAEEGEENEDEENFDSLFDPLPNKNKETDLLRPQSKDIFTIQHACHSLTQGIGAGVAYWEYLTSGPDPLVVPNNLAVISYLRLLRLSRSSKKSLQVLKDFREHMDTNNGTAFRIAMSCCARDKKNWSAFAHANEMMGLMEKDMVLPDHRVIEAYIAYVNDLSQQPGLLIHVKGVGNEFAKNKLHTNMQTLGKRLVVNLQLRAIETLRPLLARLDDAFFHGKQKPSTRWTDFKKTEWVPAYIVMKNMARVHQIVGNVLKVENAIFVSKEARKALESDSAFLGRYSDQKLRDSQNRRVFPTKEQRLQFDESKHKNDPAKDITDLKKTKKHESLEGEEVTNEVEEIEPEKPRESIEAKSEA